MISPDFKKLKQNKTKISMITCYDHWSAKILNHSDIDSILVGDSSSMVVFGNENTLSSTVNQIALLTKAVRRGAPEKFIVSDMPFLSYRKDLASNMSNVEKLMQAGANAVKIEAADGNLEFISHVVESGVPVMGHIGLTPQFVNAFGGHKVQGRDENAKNKLIADAKALQKAGCFSIVLECIPASLTKSICSSVEIPCIGIGAGPDADGQVLVLQDMLGMSSDFKPKFLRKYLDGYNLILQAINQFHSDVITRDYPNIEESYE